MKNLKIITLNILNYLGNSIAMQNGMYYAPSHINFEMTIETQKSILKVRKKTSTFTLLRGMKLALR